MMCRTAQYDVRHRTICFASPHNMLCVTAQYGVRHHALRIMVFGTVRRQGHGLNLIYRFL
jgi:hypothetical protein